jgi:hypothetical protein
MTQAINQFNQTAERGQIALLNGEAPAISAIIDSSVSGVVKTGDGVKIVATSKGAPKVAPVSGVSDAPAGFVLFNAVKNEYAANDRVEIAITGAFMYMTAGAALSAGVKVAYNPATGQVVAETPAVADTSTGAITPSNASGTVLDASSAAGDLIRVKIAGLL